MLDRYDFEHELATGARGAVYRAREKSTGRAVAIRIAPDAADGSAGEHSATVSAASSVPRHPDITPVYDSGRAGHLSYRVSAIGPGSDLAHHAHPSRLLPLGTVLLVIARVASALQHAHRFGIVHGDVKPSNIMFDPVSGAVALIDFPAAPRESWASPAYASPERLCGAGASTASDQFALGVTLYQLCCGALPFGGRTRAQIVRCIVREPHIDLRVVAPVLPDALVSIIDKALAKDPRRRYSSIGGMGRAVARLLRTHRT